MKNRKREETTKKTKRQTSEAKKSESEKGSCGSRGETKQKRGRREGETQREIRAGRIQRGGSARRYGEKVWREGSEQRFGEEAWKSDSKGRGCRKGMQRPAARGRTRRREPLRRPEPAGNDTQDDGDSFQR